MVIRDGAVLSVRTIKPFRQGVANEAVDCLFLHPVHSSRHRACTGRGRGRPVAPPRSPVDASQRPSGKQPSPWKRRSRFPVSKHTIPTSGSPATRRSASRTSISRRDNPVAPRLTSAVRCTENKAGFRPPGTARHCTPRAVHPAFGTWRTVPRKPLRGPGIAWRSSGSLPSIAARSSASASPGWNKEVMPVSPRRVPP